MATVYLVPMDGEGSLLNYRVEIEPCDFPAGSQALAADEVHLWRVDLDRTAEDETLWQQLLSSDEVVRAARFRIPLHRQHFVAARGLLRTILGAYLARNPQDVHFCYSDHGKPAVAEPNPARLSFNITHSGGVALFAFTHAREIGVDIERIRRNIDTTAIAQRFFSRQEQQQLDRLPTSERQEGFFRCWTRKEAYLKATGNGFSLSLRDFDVSVRAGDGNALLGARPNHSEARRWSVHDVALGPDYAAALAVEGIGWQLKQWDL